MCKYNNLVHERNNLNSRLTRLKEYVIAGIVGDETDENRGRVIRQVQVMQEYLDILNERVAEAYREDCELQN